MCIGMAASMGAFLLSAGTKGKRFALPNSEIMIHQPSVYGGLSGQTTDIKIYTDRLIQTKRRLTEITAKNCGKSFEEVERDMERDYFMSADEALAYGVIDKVIEKRL
jgi:ATP-dependent Clp protease protease subunit